MAEDQSSQSLPALAQRIDITASMALFPALTVMVFLRCKIGYRFLDPMRLFIMTLLLRILMGTDFLYRWLKSLILTLLFYPRDDRLRRLATQTALEGNEAGHTLA